MPSLILIVDDDSIAREGLEAILLRDGYQIEMASNGIEAIEKAVAFSPDLILLDVMMPGMDGFEVCRRIRAIPEIAEVPVLILTALDDRESFLHGLEAGADDFLVKPINRYELRARVNTITRLNRYRSLLKERARISELTSQLINLQEAERQWIARELHDEVGQLLASLSIGLRLLKDDVQGEAGYTRIDELTEVTRQTISQLQQLGHNLRPPALDTIGLAPTLEGYCRDFANRTSLPVRFLKDDELPTLSDLYNITLYRFLQEALTNTLKHADASQVWVWFTLTNAGVSVAVRDDGVGFPQTLAGDWVAPLQRKDGSTGLGLLGMRERIALLNGRFEIESQPGQGSRLTAWLPLPTP